MKKIKYEFEVPDFCPEQCKAFSPFDYRGNRLGCLHDTKCEELYRHLKEMEKRATVWGAACMRPDEGIRPYADKGDPVMEKDRQAERAMSRLEERLGTGTRAADSRPCMRPDEGIRPYAGEGSGVRAAESVGPYGEMTDAVLGFAHALEKAAEDAQEAET